MTKKINIPNIGIAEVSEYIPSEDIEKQILNFEEQAEKDILNRKQTANVHFRWSEFEIASKKNCWKIRNALSNLFKVNPKTSYGYWWEKIYVIKNRDEGIRTLGGVAPAQSFQDCTLNHSDTSLFNLILLKKLIKVKLLRYIGINLVNFTLFKFFKTFFAF